MQENKQEQMFLTVAEFADRVGITTQAVYQRLQKDLGKYCKTEHGKKVINAEAVALFSEENQGNLRDTGRKEDASESVANDLQRELIATLQTQNEQLSEQNRELLSLLQEERKSLQEKDDMIASLTNRLTTLVEQEQELTKRALQAAEGAQFLHAASEGVLEAQEAHETADEQIPSEPEKRGLWRRMFGRAKQEKK